MRRSPRKNEKKPVFVLNITIAPEDVDNCLDPSKSIVQFRVSLAFEKKKIMLLKCHYQNTNTVISTLSTAIRSFLERNGFLYQNSVPAGQSAESPSPRKRKKIEFTRPDDSGYAEWDPIAGMSELSFQDDEPSEPAVSAGTLFASTVRGQSIPGSFTFS